MTSRERMFKYLKFASVFALASNLFAADIDFRKEKIEPWFTGTLLSPEGHTLAPGVVKLRPYIFASDSIGTYGHIWQRSDTPRTRSLNGVMNIGVGILRWLDFDATFQGFINHDDGPTSYRRGDIYATFGFQITEDTRRGWTPDFRFFITQSFPFGNYDKLNPAKNGTDVSSSGSYETTFAVVFQKLFHTAPQHWLRFKFSAGITHPRAVSVDGFNTYGGGFGCSGQVKPGNKSTGMLSLEYNLWRELVFAIDFVGMYAKSAKFTGDAGVDEEGNVASIRLDNLGEFSIAPALEYNFSKTLGIVGGVWFSMLGRNDDEYFSAAISLVKKL